MYSKLAVPWVYRIYKLNLEYHKYKKLMKQ